MNEEEFVALQEERVAALGLTRDDVEFPTLKEVNHGYTQPELNETINFNTKLEALQCEYRRCFPGCKMPKYHIPLFFIENLVSGETRPNHLMDVPRISLDGKKRNKSSNWNKTWNQERINYV